MTDPRERIETKHIKCRYSPKCWKIGGSPVSEAAGYADWPELVELAQKILAADEAWLDANTPTLEELRAKYPAWSLDIVTTESNVVAMYEHRELDWPAGSHDVTSGPQGIRWLAAKLEELTDGK